MFEVSKEVEFDAGHRVPNHKSKCRSPHGHRYRVRAGICGELIKVEGASDEGMLADFGDLKTLMMEKIHDVLDHGFIAYVGDNVMIDALAPSTTGEQFKVILFPYIPTAENLALWCFEQLKAGAEEMGFLLAYVTIWETPTSIASYMEDADDAPTE